MLQIGKLVLHEFDQSRGNMRLVELGLELFLVDDMSFDLHNLDSLPPSSGGTSEKVSGEKHLLIVTNFGDLQVVVDGVKPFISIKWFSALGKHMWISVLEILQLGTGFLITIPATVVVGMPSG
jgi:hypothetical protein